LRVEILFALFFAREVAARFEFDGELMMKRTAATRFFERPSDLPISSAEGTRLRMVYVMHPVYGRFESPRHGAQTSFSSRLPSKQGCGRVAKPVVPAAGTAAPNPFPSLTLTLESGDLRRSRRRRDSSLRSGCSEMRTRCVLCHQILAMP
jgi:hypothetical protein